jgi:uncharacterized protein
MLQLLARNPTLCQVMDRSVGLELPDTWVAGGCLFQTAWNVLSGKDPEQAICDYDVFYFDASDTSRESEDRANLRAATLFADLDCQVDVRNQARVHLWYEDEFGVAYPPLGKSTDGIDRFLAVCCMVAIRRTADGSLDLYAPLGVEDALSMTMRPNPWFPGAPGNSYARKAARWKTQWPELVVLPYSLKEQA